MRNPFGMWDYILSRVKLACMNLDIAISRSLLQCLDENLPKFMAEQCIPRAHFHECIVNAGHCRCDVGVFLRGPRLPCADPPVVRLAEDKATQPRPHAAVRNDEDTGAGRIACQFEGREVLDRVRHSGIFEIEECPDGNLGDGDLSMARTDVLREQGLQFIANAHGRDSRRSPKNKNYPSGAKVHRAAATKSDAT